MQEDSGYASVTLPPGTQLTFLHYARCKLVTVSGGTVTLNRADYRVNGKIESEKDSPCPRVYALGDGGDGRSTDSIVARGVSTAPHWPVNPEFIFTGQRAGAITAWQRSSPMASSMKPVPMSLTTLRAGGPASPPMHHA